jgi:N-acetylglucosaminyldiphosphoundecaprenol N-acetyl-beta-D-mannosaminyltransferase
MPLQGQRRLVIGGLPITGLTQVEWAELMVRDCRTNSGRSAMPKFMTSANGHILSLYARDQAFKTLLDQADGIDADGMPLVLASRLLASAPLPERVATTDFFHVAAQHAEQAGLSFYLLGGTEEDNRSAVERIRAAHPRLRMAGRHHGYFADEEEDDVVQQIVAAAPDVVWVGMGAPHEQRFIVRNRARLTGVTWIKSCGGLFKFLSGRDPRAPRWMQACGLEWLFRLAHEPRRLFLRYFLTNGHAIYLMYKHRALTRDSDRDAGPGSRHVTGFSSG